MKKIITGILVFITLHSFSQVNFFQTGAKWGYYSLENPDTPWDPYRIWLEQDELTGDTIINNIIYKKLHRHIQETDMPGSHPGIPSVVNYDQSFEYLRYDSLSNKIYFISDIDTIEKLIYDFNLNVGDMVPSSISPTASSMYVDSIENITLFGVPVRKFYIVSDTLSPGINPDQYIIEGMGGSNGLTYLQPHDVLLISAHTVTDIVCFQLDNNVYPSGSSCDLFNGITENIVYSQNSLFPNPFYKDFRVNIPTSENNVSLKIFDVTGREVYFNLVTDKSVISDFSPTGIFSWRLIKNGKTIGSGKLIHLED